jgi:hypothetical protein
MWTAGWLTAVCALALLATDLAPPFVAFGAAVTSAALWCRWLEQHPESTDGTPGLPRA